MFDNDAVSPALKTGFPSQATGEPEGLICFAITNRNNAFSIGRLSFIPEPTSVIIPWRKLLALVIHDFP